MSKPDLFPKTTTAGITVDPKTLERVIPETRRPDGSVRQQRKIRPGFTPQEDVSRFRGTRQQQAEASVLPKGHIVGWITPSSTSTSAAAKSKSAKKNEKRKEKRKDKAADAVTAKIKENWEDEDEEEVKGAEKAGKEKVVGGGTRSEPSLTTTGKDAAETQRKDEDEGDALAEKLKKLDVR